MPPKKVVPAVVETRFIKEYNREEARLAELRQYEGAKFNVTVPQEMAKAKKARAEIQLCISDLEKNRVEVKAPALEHCRRIDGDAKVLEAELRALKDPIHDQIKAEENRIEAERAEKIRLENERRQNIQNQINKFRNVALVMAGKTALEIAEILHKVREAVVDAEKYQEYLQEAITARDAAVVALESLVIDTQEREAENARIIAEREELAALRKADEERKEAERREQVRLDVERKAALEKEDTERRAAQAKEDDARAAAQDAENVRAEKERFEREEKHQAQLAEQARLDKEKAQLAEQKRLQEQQAKDAAERLRKLSAAKRATPEKALADILALTNNAMNPLLALAEIALIAEASLPSEKPVKGTKK